jgi:transcriptional regulator with XRE-family HTH domain
MTVIDEWTGRHAHALRTALRLTNEAFAEQLGISPRTLTKWRERPELIPSPPLQEALDAFLNQASTDAKQRFAANLGLDERRIPVEHTVLDQLTAALGDLARALARLESEDPQGSPSP